MHPSTIHEGVFTRSHDLNTQEVSSSAKEANQNSLSWNANVVTVMSHVMTYFGDTL